MSEPPSFPFPYRHERDPMSHILDCIDLVSEACPPKYRGRLRRIRTKEVEHLRMTADDILRDRAITPVIGAAIPVRTGREWAAAVRAVAEAVSENDLHPDVAVTALEEAVYSRDEGSSYRTTARVMGCLNAILIAGLGWIAVSTAYPDAPGQIAALVVNDEPAAAAPSDPTMSR